MWSSSKCFYRSGYCRREVAHKHTHTQAIHTSHQTLLTKKTSFLRFALSMIYFNISFVLLTSSKPLLILQTSFFVFYYLKHFSPNSISQNTLNTKFRSKESNNGKNWSGKINSNTFSITTNLISIEDYTANQQQDNTWIKPWPS